MDQERWRRAKEFFHSALECEPEAREAFLEDACGEDADLRQQVELLLRNGEQAGSFLEKPALDEMARLTPAPAPSLLGRQFGPYRILSPLGAGGMGEVYRAHDSKLGRDVAIKTLPREFAHDPERLARFRREARTLASLNHPNIAAIYGLEESGDVDCLVTELVEGEILHGWLEHSPSLERRVEVARQVLEALRAAHAADIVHRDLKPANIMVRFDGYVKVLDFGLAKRMPVPRNVQDEETATMSVPGQIMGTAAYMSPEQIRGQEVDQRSDLFSFGIVLYEMLAGHHPWARQFTVDTLHAILHDEPPPMQFALAGVVDELLRKNRDDRYPSAEAVLQALASQPPQAPSARALTRLIVLPFRILRKHEASDFLAVSLPDAITSSLAAIDSLVVRSTMAASCSAAAPELDVKTIAEQAQVDAILTGTILSDGEHLRVNAQLVQAPDGTLLWSNASQVSLRDIFQLQDELVDRIVQSLMLPLTAREQRTLKHDVPASALGYEFFLRANQLVANPPDSQNIKLARDLYLQSVDADPMYAPTWAHLGRTHRLLGKFAIEDLTESFARAEQAFQKAFALNPELAVAHNFYTFLQTEMGHSRDALERLLKRAHKHRNDPNLLAGLVHACRYCGLLDASAAAHRLAKRLDPTVRTSVAYTFLHLGDYQSVLDYQDPEPFGIIGALVGLGRKQEAMAEMLKAEKKYHGFQLGLIAVADGAILEGDLKKGREALEQALAPPGVFVSDPEANYYNATRFAKLNEPGRALESLSEALDRGYRCYYALLHDSDFDPLRSYPQFAELVTRAAALDVEARTVFLDNGGDRLLGVSGAAR